MASRVWACAQTHQIVHVKYVQSAVCQLCLNRAGFLRERTKGNDLPSSLHPSADGPHKWVQGNQDGAIPPASRTLTAGGCVFTSQFSIRSLSRQHRESTRPVKGLGSRRGLPVSPAAKGCRLHLRALGAPCLYFCVGKPVGLMKKWGNLEHVCTPGLTMKAKHFLL